MNIIITFFLTMLLVQTTVAGQRLSGIQLGSSCDLIPQFEKQLGSVALDAHDSKGISKYTGTQGGNNATIVYHCAQGRLTKKEIIITSTSQSKAYQIADKQSEELTDNLGAPIHDGLNLKGFRKIMYGVLGADLDYLTSVVVWGRAKEDVMLIITETEDNLWVITISQGGSKMEYILNS